MSTGLRFIPLILLLLTQLACGNIPDAEEEEPNVYYPNQCVEVVEFAPKGKRTLVIDSLDWTQKFQVKGEDPEGEREVLYYWISDNVALSRKPIFEFIFTPYWEKYFEENRSAELHGVATECQPGQTFQNSDCCGRSITWTLKLDPSLQLTE